MAFTTIPTADIATGKPLKQTLFQYIKDNDDWLKSQVDNISAGSGMVNGSFEFDSDSDGVPDGWARTLGAGASSAFDTTTPAHGGYAFKFSTAGSTNNYLESTDYLRCSPQIGVVVEFLTKSSAAGVCAAIQIRWYDKTPSYLSTTEMYYEGTASPTSWTKFVRAAVPPANAVYYKLRVYGGTGGGTGHPTTDSTSGDVYFDGMFSYNCPSGGLTYTHSATIAEQGTTSSTWVDLGSHSLPLPANLSATSLVRILFYGSVKGSGTYAGYQRFRIGSSYSYKVTHGAGGNHDDHGTSSASYLQAMWEISHYGSSGGSVTLQQQIYSPDSATIYGKKDVGLVVIEVLAW